MKIFHLRSFNILCSLLGVSVISCFYAYHSQELPKSGSQEISTFPLLFEKNMGQMDDSVQYLSNGFHTSFQFKNDNIELLLHDSKSQECVSLNLQFLGASPHINLQPKEALQSSSNYFLGSDAKKWHTHVLHYSKLCYQNIYPNIDAIFYGNEGQCEYDFVVSPGGDPTKISLEIRGISSACVSDNGDLHLYLSTDKELLMKKPFAYQMNGKEENTIPSEFFLLARNENSVSVGFHVDAYDPSKKLIIDPILSYSSYLGGNLSDVPNNIAVDTRGNIYVIQNYFKSGGNNDSKGIITKIDGKTKKILYSTFLGTNQEKSYTTQCLGISVDSSGNAYVVGSTEAVDFPVYGTPLCPNPFLPDNPPDSCGFISVLNPQGSGFIYSSYLGGSGNAHSKGDSALGVTVSPNGNAYVTGQTYSSDFPQVGPTLSPSADPANGVGFVCGINPHTPSFIYSSYLGGSGVTFDGETFYGDVGYAIAIDPSENAYVTGQAYSVDFPLKGNTLSPEVTPAVGVGFVSAIHTGGTGFIYSSYLGGNGIGGDKGSGIAADAHGNATVVGLTHSGNFPVHGPTLAPTANPNNQTGFVSAINPNGPSFIYSTLLGGQGFTSSGTIFGDQVNSVALDTEGNAYITGITRSNDFPLIGKSIAPQSVPTYGSAFVTAIRSDGSHLIYSTLLGGDNFTAGYGIALNSFSTAYVSGRTFALNFPEKGPSLSYNLAPWPKSVEFITAIAQVSPPANLAGTQVMFSKKKGGLTNVLTWENPVNDESKLCKPVKYKIYRDANLTELVGVVSAKKTLRFEDKNRDVGVSYTYYVVGINKAKEVSQPRQVTIP